MISNWSATEDLVLATKLHQSDIPQKLFSMLSKAQIIAWDIETSGLNWRTDRIATCQLYAPGMPPIVVRVGDSAPSRLIALLEDGAVKKVFHYAMFDLRFLAHAWSARPQNIACTKIAAKLLDRANAHSHSLKALLDQYLDISIDKTEWSSDWFSPELSKGQLEYAVKDVLYLPALLAALERELEKQGLLPLALECFRHLPTHVQLDILGYDDLYGYH